MDAIRKFANSESFERILNALKRRRTLVLKLAFPILLVRDILTGHKPHELGFSDVSVWAIIGFILVLAGAFIRLWARGHFVKGRLFTTGPYALIRHPLYLGSLLVVVGVLFQLNDWLNWMIILSLFAVFYGAAIIHEERSLAKEFGRQFQFYKVKTPAFIPSLTSWLRRRRAGKWGGKTFLATGELATTLMFLSLPLLIELIEDFVFEGMLGV